MVPRPAGYVRPSFDAAVNCVRDGILSVTFTDGLSDACRSLFFSAMVPALARASTLYTLLSCRMGYPVMKRVLASIDACVSPGIAQPLF